MDEIVGNIPVTFGNNQQQIFGKMTMNLDVETGRVRMLIEIQPEPGKELANLILSGETIGANIYVDPYVNVDEHTKMLEGIDRNARAYGWEIGRGNFELGKSGEMSRVNPFQDPNWREAYPALPNLSTDPNPI